jgi:enediyne biosynthesis thioesterase
VTRPRTYDYRHVVTLEDTNLVGNVYYASHVRWQGRCRDLFLRDHAPQIIDDLRRDLRLVTTRCACEYFAELSAFDVVTVRMRLVELAPTRITMAFDYERGEGTGAELVARGEQQVVAMRRHDGRWAAAAVPEALRAALEPYRA